MNFEWVPGTFSVLKFAPDVPWQLEELSATLSPPPKFLTWTFTQDECSLMLEETHANRLARHYSEQLLGQESDFRCFRVSDTMDFSLVGVVAQISQTLADAKISILTVSTFDTDYFLVRASDLKRSQDALQAAGHTFP